MTICDPAFEKADGRWHVYIQDDSGASIISPLQCVLASRRLLKRTAVFRIDSATYTGLSDVRGVEAQANTLLCSLSAFASEDVQRHLAGNLVILDVAE